MKAGARVDASGVGNHLSLPPPTLQAIGPCTSNAPEPSRCRPQSAAFSCGGPYGGEGARSGWGSGSRLNRSLAPIGVRCSELALHSVPAQSPQTTNARCARGEEPKATEFDCGPALVGSTGYKRSEFLRTISVRLPPRAERETRHPPTAPRAPRLVRGGVREGRVGCRRRARRTRATHRRGVSRSTPSRSPRLQRGGARQLDRVQDAVNSRAAQGASDSGMNPSSELGSCREDSLKARLQVG